jgi:hypothetical protein
VVPAALVDVLALVVPAVHAPASPDALASVARVLADQAAPPACFHLRVRLRPANVLANARRAVLAATSVTRRVKKAR